MNFVDLPMYSLSPRMKYAKITTNSVCRGQNVVTKTGPFCFAQDIITMKLKAEETTPCIDNNKAHLLLGEGGGLKTIIYCQLLKFYLLQIEQLLFPQRIWKPMRLVGAV